jgi:flagellar biosynthesis chaperone FliJ
MAADPLQVLLTIRQRGVDQARQVLAVCLNAETAAMAAIEALENAQRREREVADSQAEHHRGTNMFATWSGQMRVRQSAARAVLGNAETATTSARVGLTETRSAARAVERLIEERAIVARVEAAKREQHALDDIARTRAGERDGRAGMTGP